MIAIIKHNHKTTYRIAKYKTLYVTNVLAAKYDYGNSQAIVFDDSFTKILKLDMYRPMRTVYMIQEDNLEFKRGEWQGLDWVINDSELMAKLEKGSVDIKDYPKAQEYAHKVELPEWFEIKNEADAKNLINISAGFHDGEPIKAIIDGNDMELVLDKSFACKFTLKFMDIVDMDIIGKAGIIYGSEMEVKDGIICWTITGSNFGWVNNIDWDRCPQISPYIKCKKILWKIDVD